METSQILDLITQLGIAGVLLLKMQRGIDELHQLVKNLQTRDAEHDRKLNKICRKMNIDPDEITARHPTIPPANGGFGK